MGKKSNKNPNRPKGRGIFNVSDTPPDNGGLMQNNPTTASSGVLETNQIGDIIFGRIHYCSKRGLACFDGQSLFERKIAGW